MTIQKVTVVVDSADIHGDLFTYGYVGFAPPFRLPDPDDQLLLEQAATYVYFDDDPHGTAAPAIDLYPNDLLGPQQDDGTPGWPYRITYYGCPGDPQFWDFYLLSTNGSPQYLHVLAETPAVQPGSIAGDKNFTLDFGAATSVTVLHKLGKKPAVSVIDSAGDQVNCGVTYPDNNTVILSFSAAMGGTVTCN